MASYRAAKSDAVSIREQEHGALVRALAPQGMVLLQNDGVLPLRGPEPVALFGAGARHTVKGGTGSGDVNVRRTVTVEQGLLNAGFTVVSGGWLGEYDRQLGEAQAAYQAMLAEKSKAGENPILFFFSNPFVTPDTPPVTAETVAAAPATLAIYVLSRNSGEGKDRSAAPGDYLLSEREKADLSVLAAAYPRLVVLLNVGGVIDTAFLRGLEGLNALLLMSQAGACGGDAVADALLGVTPPSGRLTDTWALDYGDYPSSATFGKNDGNLDDEPYGEGIFVGYRYFDTFGKPVAYPFGFGLDYTQYRLETRYVEADEYGVTVKVRVTNTGARPGRQVVQIYVSQPAGGLEKPYQVLAAFAKTHQLEPGEQQTLSISFPLKSMASYCEKCASWVLEPGKYYIRVGVHSRDTHIAAAVELTERNVVEVLKNLLTPVKPLPLLSGAGATPISYPGEEAEKAAAPVLKPDCGRIACQTHTYAAEAQLPADTASAPLTLAEVASGKATAAALAAQLTVEELAYLCVGSGASGGEPGAESMIGAASVAVPGAAGQTTSRLLASRGLQPLVLADGPAGLRLTRHFRADASGKLVAGGGMMAALSGEDDPAGAQPPKPGETDYYQFCTAIPIATLIAQSWDTDLAARLGRMVGAEMLEYGVSLWLAPGMNIHRNPLCGRNFEYYSEDPLLSGVIAAADTLGVQANPGVGVTPKHYACNNQEDNRNYADSIVSERALREIYLRGFEICVRSAQPMSVMSSYNFLNGVHSANNRDLLTAALRDEWGFEGFVMTDWGTTGFGAMMPGEGKDSIPAYCILAGNDLIMPGGKNDVLDILDSVAGKTGHPISADCLRLSAARILAVSAASHLYPEAKPWSARFPADWFVTAE